MIKYYAFIFAALLSGAAIGFYFGGEKVSPTPAEEKPQVQEKSSAIPDAGSEAIIEALNARIAELESRLAERRRPRRAQAGSADAEGVEVEERPRGRRERAASRDERVEAFRRANPEAYSQMTNRVAEWRQGRIELHRNKMDILNSINPAHLGPAAVETHETLKALVEEREQVEADLMNPDLTWEERGESMRKLGEIDREMRRLNGEERAILISETARELGLQGSDAEAFAGAINDIFTVTDNDAFGGRPPRGPGGPGGFGGPRGR